MRKLIGTVLIGGIASGFLAMPQSAPAHHSGAMFDDEQVLEMGGTVTRFDYVNPHSWLYVNVEADDGSITEWGFELGAPPLLRRAGISPRAWQEGDRVNLRISPLKDGRPAGLLRGIIKTDGSTYGQDTEGLSPPTS